MNKGFYICKGCHYKTSHKNDMRKHYGKKNKCNENINATIELIKYCYDTNNNIVEFEEFINKKFTCEECARKFSKKYDYNRHIKAGCFKNFINNSFNNISNTINNNITNNYTVNLTAIIKGFCEEWDTSKIDSSKKTELLLTEQKFTKTLENILLNKNNLNVIVNGESDQCFVYNDNKLESMTMKDVANYSMVKLYNHLNSFQKELEEDKELNYRIGCFNIEKKIINDRYMDYINNIEVEKKVNIYIIDIYEKNLEETKKLHQNLINDNVETSNVACKF